ncbi:hypothetical protein DH2020_035229 [Rehmannia glutinosa]|uniref:Syringolide-induced protein 14-1-1 n=1 Tax=Rehmannia glutinosa TaxID=99300 RepID=A0ABR0V7S6_REHGL
MEKPATKSKYKILRAVQAAVTFQNLLSPRGDKRADAITHRLKAHHNKGFSGPILPMIPAEARGKSKNFEAQEPTSPKVSCMGQIKHKKKISKKKHASLTKELKHVSLSKPEKSKKARPIASDPDMKKKQSGIKKVFGAGRNSQAKPPIPGAAPSLSHMRKFASSRDTFANFDWTTAQIAPEEDRGFYSDGERGFSDGEDDVIIPFSAPILVLEPRKEINLWKRRTMAQPKPLQLNVDKEI